MYSDRQPPENESDETKQENCEVHDDTHVDDVIMEEEDVNLGQLLVEVRYTLVRHFTATHFKVVSVQLTVR